MKTIITFLFAAAVFQLAAQCTLAQLSQARMEASMVANENTVVIGGGYYLLADGSPYFSDRVDIYVHVPLSCGWSQASLSSPRYSAGVAAAGDKVIFAGGFRNDSITGVVTVQNTVDIYDVVTHQWAVETLPAGPRGYLRGISVGTKAYFMGGCDGSQAFTASVQIYDTETGTWWQGSDIPFISGTASIAAFGQFIMLKLGEVYGIYDTESDTWESGTFPAATPLRQAPVVTPTEVWFIGGYDAATLAASDRILIYNIAEKTWSEKTLALARSGATACYLNGKILVAGGQSIHDIVPNTATDLVEIYNTETEAWSAGFTLSEPRCNMSYQETAPVLKGHGIINEKAFFPVGDNSGDGSASNVVDIYTDLPASGTLLPQLPDEAWKIYPQPCRDFFNVEMLVPTAATTLTIFDTWGRLVHSMEIAEYTAQSHLIDTSSLPAGNYMILLSNELGISAKRLVKAELSPKFKSKYNRVLA